MFIRFLHPDLGIGGAERLVLDLALALDSKGHEVQLCTNHWTAERHFPETIRGSKFHPKIYFSLIPRHIFGKFFALLAYLKMILAACFIGIFSSRSDVIIMDQISHSVPFFKFFNAIRSFLTFKTRTKVLFYCHYPDQLLSRDLARTRKEKFTVWKEMYRLPLDRFEKYSTKKADTILVNSKFTGRVVAQTFDINAFDLKILYPVLDPRKFENADRMAKTCELLKFMEEEPVHRNIVLSVNRYEKKKNIKLAIQALAKIPIDKRPILIIAGGYDSRKTEDFEYKKELEELTEKLKLTKFVKFYVNISDQEKIGLLAGADCLIYTPQNEHFGIVPIEAMACGTPVVAMKSGGPLETVSCKTGILVDHSGTEDKLVKDTAKAIEVLLKDRGYGRWVSDCKQHVRTSFSFEAFAVKIENACLKSDKKFEIQRC